MSGITLTETDLDIIGHGIAEAQKESEAALGERLDDLCRLLGIANQRIAELETAVAELKREREPERRAA